MPIEAFLNIEYNKKPYWEAKLIIRLIIWIIITLFIVLFVVFNVEPKVNVYILPGVTLENIPLALVIIISFILGLLAGMILFLGQIIKYQLELRRARKHAHTETKTLGGKDED